MLESLFQGMLMQFTEQQQEKLKLLQTELSMLNSALGSAQQSLNKAMQQQELSDEQVQTALSLML